MTKPDNKEKKENSKWIIDGILDKIEVNAVNFMETLSSIWESIWDFFTDLYEKVLSPLIPDSVKNWFKSFFFASKEKINNIYKTYEQLKWKEKPDFLPFCLAMQWYNKQKGKIGNSKYLTVIDYSKPVNQNRLYVINMQTLTVENCVQTWHGKNSGDTKTTSRFSNTNNSNQTSIGFFRTPEKPTPNSQRTWDWLFLTWMEFSNDQARGRWIAVHGVWDFFYWSDGWNKKHTKYHKKWESTSEGCITIRHKDNPNEIMNKIKGDSLIYSYYPDMTYLNKSTLIK